MSTTSKVPMYSVDYGCFAYRRDGYAPALELVGDVLELLGFAESAWTAWNYADDVRARYRALRTAEVEPTVREWEVADDYAESVLGECATMLTVASELSPVRSWRADVYGNSFIVAPSEWWDALEV